MADGMPAAAAGVPGPQQHVLQPRSASSMNRTRPWSLQHGQKRPSSEDRRDGGEDGGGERLRGGSDIIIRLRSEDLEEKKKPIVMKPLQLVPRSALRLAYLRPPVVVPSQSATATANANVGCALSRLFRAWISMLEPTQNPDLGESESESEMVLVGEERSCEGGDGDAGLLVVERVEEGVYVLCRLASGITLADLGSRNRRKILEMTPKPAGNDASRGRGGLWWKAASVDKSILAQGNTSQKGQSQRQLMMLMEPISRDTESCLHHKPQPAQPHGDSFDGLTAKTHSSNEPKKPAEDLKDKDDLARFVSKHYLDALYLSRASLAYFAKGPLSKARSACRVEAPTQPSFSLMDLKDLLHSRILKLAVLDKKYSAAIPTTLEDVPPSITPEEWLDQKKLKSLLKKSNNRKSVNKDGLLPCEESYFFRWWIESENSSDAKELAATREERTKAALKSQKARETHLQVMLILEIMAIEASAVHDNSGRLDKVIHDKNVAPTPPSVNKQKKSQGLSVLLDLLVDRLCIWESMSQDAPEILGNGSVKGSQLRDFGVEVVIPFFASRLPDTCSSICRKLGANVPSPPRPRRPLQKSHSTSEVVTRTASPISKQSAPKRPRKTLERILTDDKLASQRRPTPPSTLSRAATDSTLLSCSIKWESSLDPTAPSIHNVPVHRPSFRESIDFSRREVDLSTADPVIARVRAKNDAARAARKRISQANVEEELRGAIDAIKRPNARQAVRELVDSADKRRKANPPIRNPFATAVQVTATPRKRVPLRRENSRFSLLSTQVGIDEEASLDAGSPMKEAASAIHPSTLTHPGSRPIIISATPHKAVPQKEWHPSAFRPIQGPANDCVIATPSRLRIDATSSQPSQTRDPTKDDRRLNSSEDRPDPATGVRSQAPTEVSTSTPLKMAYIPEEIQTSDNLVTLAADKEPAPKASAATISRSHYLSSQVLATPTKGSVLLNPKFVPSSPCAKPGLELHQSVSGVLGSDSGTGLRQSRAKITKAPNMEPENEENSIYSALGWDDDLIDEIM